ncbi:MAG: TauD/TfdA family dioxygenase [Actinomycetota bacterium]
MGTLTIELSGQACGATVRGVDLRTELDAQTVAELRAAWLEHRVVAFPEQELTDHDLERFTQYFGPFGHDPYIEAIDGHPHVIALHRRADETASIFAESFHADWSFQEFPPDGTCLYGIVIPPEGGDTLFADQHTAYNAMPAELRARIDDLVALHSAKVAYAPDGIYGVADDDSDRTTRIVVDESANAIQRHSLVREHPETGRRGVYSCAGYICGIDGMSADEARDLLVEIYQYQSADEVVYRHQWESGMLVMWDNRAVLHRATGGYDGHERLLHRTTIGHRSTAAA